MELNLGRVLTYRLNEILRQGHSSSEVEEELTKV
jgi:hypothetical protein